jgi:hypothetical protein
MQIFRKRIKTLARFFKRVSISATDTVPHTFSGFSCNFAGLVLDIFRFLSSNSQANETNWPPV